MSDETPNLAWMVKNEVDTLNERIAELLLDFTTRTGFVVKKIDVAFYDYRSSSGESSYQAQIKIDTEYPF